MKQSTLPKYTAGLITILLITGCSKYLHTTGEHQPAELSQTDNRLQWVDPFIGTDGKGKTYPGATVPYGMVQLSPDNGRNGWDWISGYFYTDNVIAGFSHTHLSGTGAGDLYDISFMPLAGEARQLKLDDINPKNTVISHFSHDNEAASPGYYQVYLDDYDINVELTAGLRTGVQRYTFANASQNKRVKLDLGYARNWDKTTRTQLTVINAYTIAGYRHSTGWAADQRVYFYSQFSTPINEYHIENEEKVKVAHNSYASNTGVTATFNFSQLDTNQVIVKTAISSVSIENAKENLMTDGVDPTFEQYHSNAQKLWHKALAKVDIDASDDNKTQFYTALYHSYLAPRVFSDANGQYKGPDGQTHRATDTYRYSFFSLWDTFRALHPWKTITDTVASKQMITSMMEHYEVYGLLPVWNFQGNETDMMMGYHAVPVIVDAYLKGLTDIDGEKLYQAVKKSAMQNAFGIDKYKQLGYVPFEHGQWNVSKTLEYAFDDWSIAQLAKALGKNDEYYYFSQRAQQYRQHFDQQTGFMRAKSEQGHFKPNFDPLAYHPEDYCEANAWQYNFFVPHDVDGMIALHGGKEAFVAKLDDMFTTQQSEGELPEWISGYIGQYVHGNEPAHHVPYLYQLAGSPTKTQARVRKIMDELYSTAPDGLVGNEDAGQMSAWYMFSALGFYPVNPVSGEYVLGSPEVNRAQLHLENGQTFTVIAHNQSPDNVYVESIFLNGKKYQQPVIYHRDIMAGGKLVFNMTSEPK
ncbi:GH92 family glycosyl hydrolase [Thalassotalea fusca]